MLTHKRFFHSLKASTPALIFIHNLIRKQSQCFVWIAFNKVFITQKTNIEKLAFLSHSFSCFTIDFDHITYWCDNRLLILYNRKVDNDGVNKYSTKNTKITSPFIFILCFNFYKTRSCCLRESSFDLD